MVAGDHYFENSIRIPEWEQRLREAHER